MWNFSWGQLLFTLLRQTGIKTMMVFCSFQNQSMLYLIELVGSCGRVYFCTWVPYAKAIHGRVYFCTWVPYAKAIHWKSTTKAKVKSKQKRGITPRFFIKRLHNSKTQGFFFPAVYFCTCYKLSQHEHIFFWYAGKENKKQKVILLSPDGSGTPAGKRFWFYKKYIGRSRAYSGTGENKKR
mgnify:CR=1 FL=1